MKELLADIRVYERIKVVIKQYAQIDEWRLRAEKKCFELAQKLEAQTASLETLDSEKAMNAELSTEIESLTAQLNAVTKAKDGAYWERNQLVAALTKLFPSWREKHPDSDATWESDWRNIIFIELPTGQASWHIHDSEYDYFKDLPQSAHSICSWDGHTTEEKYARLAALNQQEEKI